MSRFDVYWVRSDPSQGAEIQKDRPGVVISPDEMSALKTVIIAPLTSAVKPYSWRVLVRVRGRYGSVVLDQIRTVDKARLGEWVGKLSKAEGAQILFILGKMFSP